MNIIRIESAGSTNSYLKELAAKETLEEGTVIVAREQTAGRGQVGTSWESEPGENLTFSMLFRPTFLSLRDYFLLSEVVALGIKDALDSYIDSLSVKWPNDIYYKDLKLVGILFENEITDKTIAQSVVGVGINVNQNRFVSNAPNPVSLKQATGMLFDLEDLLEKVVAAILVRYDDLKAGKQEQITNDYHLALYRREGFHGYKDQNETFLAKIDKVDTSGFLHLVTKEGEKRQYAFKEVSVILRR